MRCFFGRASRKLRKAVRGTSTRAKASRAGNAFGKAANAAFDELDNGDHDVFIELDFRTYEADGKLHAAGLFP